MFEHEHECSNEWEHEMWMIKHELIIKLRETTWNDVSNEMFEIIRTSSENYWIDFIILKIRWLYALFKKALSQIIFIFNKRVDPFRGSTRPVI